MNSLKVFYDGSCVLCHKEIIHYKSKDNLDLLQLIDISNKEFDASKYGLCQYEVNLHMHSIDDKGIVFKGVDSFIEIWKRVPPYNFLVPIFTNKILSPGINFSYHIFAKHIRHRLPKRKCETGSCDI